MKKQNLHRQSALHDSGTPRPAEAQTASRIIDTNVWHATGLLWAALLWLSLSSAELGAQSVTVGWDASPDPTVAGYYASYGSESGVYTNKVDVGTNRTFTATGLIAGQTYYFVATSYNAEGIESVPTPELAYLVPGNITTNLAAGYAPVAATMTVYRTAGLRLLVAFSDLSTNWSDADGDTVTLASLNLLMTNGITLATNASDISYASGQNVNDQFSYTVSDTQGGMANGLVNIVVVASAVGQAQNVSVSNGTAIASFAGVPGYSYGVQRSTNLVDWLTILTTNAPSEGLFQIADNFTDLGASPGSASYRLEWNP
jgi:hypothetical protein